MQAPKSLLSLLEVVLCIPQVPQWEDLSLFKEL